MDNYKIDIKAESVMDLIQKLGYLEQTLGRKPTSVIMSEAIANRLLIELSPWINKGRSSHRANKVYSITDLKGASILLYKIHVVMGDKTDFIKVFEDVG